MDNLRYIRKTIERAGSFTAVPGIGGMLMGSTALAAAWLASRQGHGWRWLAVWIGEALVALLIGIVGAELKSRRAKLPLFSGPARKFVAGFAPAMMAGALLTGVLFQAGSVALLPGTWMLLYGAGVVSGGGRFGAGGAADGRVLHGGGGGGAAVARRLGRRAAGGGLRRTAHHFRNGDCGEIWRVSRTQHGKNGKRSRNRRQWRLSARRSGAPKLDRLIHERLRLGILSALSVNESLTFNELKKLLDTTDGNLSVHARKLEEAGYLSCTKSFEGRVPRSDYKLTRRRPARAGALSRSYGSAHPGHAREITEASGSRSRGILMSI